MQRKSNTELLYEAAEFADFTAAAGWPDELTPPQLVALWVGHEFMRPLGEADALMRRGGTEAEKKRTACKIVMRMLRDSALPTEERTETTQRPPVKRLKSLSPPVFVEEEQPAEVRKWVVVTRSAVQQCIAKLGIEPPEHINAWLAPANAHRVGVPANGTPPAPNMPARGGSARTRHDDIQIEIDDVRAGLEQQGEPATPAKVMAMLKARAGRSDSCISEAFERGVIWTRGTSGAPERLTNESLKSRLNRRKPR